MHYAVCRGVLLALRIMRDRYVSYELLCLFFFSFSFSFCLKKNKSIKPIGSTILHYKKGN